MHETVDTLLSLKIQCTFWPLLVNLRYNVKSWTTKNTTRCLPRSAACNHNLKLTQNKSQQWNQSMVELGGNKSENSNVLYNRWATLHQFQHTARQWNPYERQPSNPLGRSKRGAHLQIPGNEVGHSPTRTSTGSQKIENIKIWWGLNMRLRGVNINCELMREAQLYSQLHGELQRELSSQVTLSARRDLTR